MKPLVTILEQQKFQTENEISRIAGTMENYNHSIEKFKVEKQQLENDLEKINKFLKECEK